MAEGPTDADLACFVVRARLGRCFRCGRGIFPEGPCTPDDCSVLGSPMLARLKAREAMRG